MKYLFVLLGVLLLLAMAPVPASAQSQYPNGYYGQAQGSHGVLSAKDQQEFDKDYAKWVDATRKNDQDDIVSNARHMQDIMSRYNIPPNVPFDQVASTATPGVAGSAGYPNEGYPNYPNGAYNGNYPVYGQPARLSPDEQKNFDKA
jgi:hypothetical protein